jgi:ubiquinone/menaquinone biosynthesis C-methylase UbiE
MKKLYRYYSRGRHPRGFWGKRVLKAMNSAEHAAMPEWALSDITIHPEYHVLDIGCGGGANIKRILDKCPDCLVRGIDLSQTALEYSRNVNYRAVVDGNCVILGGNATQMPLAKEAYELVFAFETIYYWPSIETGFSEAFRVLKPKGKFVVANEHDGVGDDCREMEDVVGGIRVYTIDEIKQALAGAGFTNIQAKRDEERRYICVTATKP